MLRKLWNEPRKRVLVVKQRYNDNYTNKDGIFLLREDGENNQIIRLLNDTVEDRFSYYTQTSVGSFVHDNGEGISIEYGDGLIFKQNVWMPHIIKIMEKHFDITFHKPTPKADMNFTATDAVQPKIEAETTAPLINIPRRQSRIGKTAKKLFSK
jgi:hypothetical protein